MKLSEEEIAAHNTNYFYRHLGMSLLEMGDGVTRSQLIPEPNVCWPTSDQPHGGMIFTLLDVTSAWAVITQLEGEQSSATISMEINFTRRALGGLFTCEARVTSQARLIAFTQGEVKDTNGEVVATGQGCFRIITR